MKLYFGRVWLCLKKKKTKDKPWNLQSLEKAQRFVNLWKLDLVRTNNININHWIITSLVSSFLLFLLLTFHWSLKNPECLEGDRKENKAEVKVYNCLMQREVWGSIHIAPSKRLDHLWCSLGLGMLGPYQLVWRKGNKTREGQVLRNNLKLW